MEKNPLVSILIPTYNQPELFRIALESALNQDYPNIEIIVSDDSTDDRVKNICSEYKDVKYIYHGNTYTDEPPITRPRTNYSFLVQQANGEFINVLMHDDIIYPEKISKMMEFFKNDIDNKIAIVSSARDIIDKNNVVYDHCSLFDTLKGYGINEEAIFLDGESTWKLIFHICGNFLCEHTTCLMRKKYFYHEYATDLFCFFNACKDGAGVVYLHEPLSAFRIIPNGNQSSFNPQERLAISTDWMSLIVIAYLKDYYLHTEEDFIKALNYWLMLVDFIVKGIDINRQFSDFELIELVLQLIDAIQNKNYSLLLKLQFKWIMKNSPEIINI